MELGDYVIDADDDDPDLSVVVHYPNASIEKITVGTDDEQRTVAEDNPEYDADESAVIVAFVESGLGQDWHEWTETAAADLYEGAQEHSVKLYTFPESRLSTVSNEEAEALLADPAIDMDALQARLEDAGWDLERAGDGELVAEKMDEQYRITPTGEIEGDGQIRNPLENLVSKYHK